MTIKQPSVRVRYDLKVLGPVSLEQILDDFVKRSVKKQ
jgi:hypothetical protein